MAQRLNNDSMMTQATILKTLNQGTLPGNTHYKNLRNAKSWIPQELKKASLSNKDISHPTYYHPFQLKNLSQVSTLYVHSPHTTQPSPNSVHLTTHQQASF